MMYFSLSPSAPITDYLTRELAPKASQSAANARAHALPAADYKRQADEIRIHFNEIPLFFCACMFILATLLGIYIGWELYRAVIKSMTTLEPHPAAIVILSLLISGFSALTGHFLMHGWNGTLRRWLIMQRQQKGQNAFVAEKTLSDDVMHFRIIAVMCFMLALLLFVIMAGLREEAVTVLNPASGQNHLIFIVFPLGLFIAEMFTGEWFLLWCRLQWLHLAGAWHRWRFYSWKRSCIVYDREIQQHWAEAQQQGERIPTSRDVKDALYRIRHRNTGDAGYVDPVPFAAEDLVSAQ